MSSLQETAPAFVAMAHQIVWCTAATVDAKKRPRARVLHPIWEWDGKSLTGWIATEATPIKRVHLESSAHLSCNYWTPTQDTCVAECRARWHFDLPTREAVWKKFAEAPAPVGYDPSIIPQWESAASASFSVLRLEPWRLRVMPGSLMTGGGGEVLVWNE